MKVRVLILPHLFNYMLYIASLLIIIIIIVIIVIIVILTSASFQWDLDLSCCHNHRRNGHVRRSRTQRKCRNLYESGCASRSPTPNATSLNRSKYVKSGCTPFIKKDRRGGVILGSTVSACNGATSTYLWRVSYTRTLAAFHPLSPRPVQDPTTRLTVCYPGESYNGCFSALAFMECLQKETQGKILNLVTTLKSYIYILEPCVYGISASYKGCSGGCTHWLHIMLVQYHTWKNK